MTLQELPTRTDGLPHYVMRVRLDGSDYVFTFRFGERREVWVFDLDTLAGVRVVTGKMVLANGSDLLRSVVGDDRPPGTLFAWNVSLPTSGGEFALPGLYDLGGPDGRCRLYYLEAEA